MELEARTLEPLGEHHVSIRVLLQLDTCQREAKQSQRAAIRIEIWVLQAVALPVLQECAAYVSIRHIEMTTGSSNRIVGVRLIPPIPPLCFQQFISKSSQENVVGCWILGWYSKRLRSNHCVAKVSWRSGLISSTGGLIG